jgi:XTP/dITP diphosphohydrolase
MKLVFATHNHNKAHEIQALLNDQIELITLDDIQCFEEIPETAVTLEGNAKMKAAYVVEQFNMNCFADDTGLEIDALNNEPGVYSARYAGEDRDPEKNMNLVLEKLAHSTNRKARFRTVISLYWQNEFHEFEGIVEGEITTSKSGAKGFGYDPIFKPENSEKTFAEMDLVEKNTMSHRARAFEKMVVFLNTGAKP